MVRSISNPYNSYSTLWSPVCGHGPILNTTQTFSKNGKWLHRAFTNNEIANNSSISCFKIMNKAAMPAEPDNNETNRA